MFCIKLAIIFGKKKIIFGQKKIQIFKENSYKNVSFILLLCYTLKEKLHGNALSKNIFPTRNFG